MAVVKPFKGYRYSNNKIESIEDVMAPPYDALSVEETDSCYDKSPYNAVRLVSQRKFDSDTDADNCYTRASDSLKSWIDDGVLVKDSKPAFYIYEETVTINRENYYNRGIVCLLELTEYTDGIVVPCEEPSTDSKMDRFNMIKATGSNNSLISCIYTERSKDIATLLAEICTTPADMDFVANGHRHKLWTVTESERINLIQQELADKKMFIVDGHNRYEACLEYKKEKMQFEDYTGKESCNYVMALISDSHDDGRVHMPVHRLIKCGKNFSEAYFIAGLQECFHIEKIIVDKSDDDIAETMRKLIATQRKEAKIAMYTGKDYFYRFIFKGEEYLSNLMPDVSESYRFLDLNILNKLILEEQMGIDASTDSERIAYTRDIQDGMNSIDNHEYDCMFVINPVRPPQFSAMTETGERLPKRSVSIFPKPATGIVIHKFTSDLNND